MYFGQSDNLYVVKLKSNMTELADSVISIKPPFRFHEAAWVNYKNGLFHMTYGRNKEDSLDTYAYAIANNPYGPFKYKYEIQSEKALTVHGCVTEFKGQNYFFYHQDGIDGYHRQTCVEKFKYTKDGYIPPIPRTKAGIGNIYMNLDPYGRHEIEDYYEASDGIKRFVEPFRVSDHYVEVDTYINVSNNSEWVCFKNLNFGDSPKSIEIEASCGAGILDASIEIHLDSIQGKIIANCKLNNTGGKFNWEKFNTVITNNVYGLHNIFFVSKGNFNDGFLFINSYRFYK
jgi:hypothetical protein